MVLAPAAAEEPKDEEKKEAKPEPTVASKAKRASIFGSIFQKVSNQEKAEKDAPPKNTETPVSSTAPQLGDPVDPSTSEPIKPESVTAAGEDSQPAKEAEEPVTSPASTKSGFLQFIKKEMKHDVRSPSSLCKYLISVYLRLTCTWFIGQEGGQEGGRQA